MQDQSNLMCNKHNLSSQCSDDRYRHLDDCEWSWGKLCQCQQCDDSIQWCIRTTYDLRWTISNGVCPSTSDNVRLQFDTPPTVATAGADQTLCSTSATLAGNTPITGTGQWTIVSGAGGSFALNTNPTTTFSGTAGTTYVLQWTISNGHMYTEFRSGNNQTRCKSIAYSGCRITSDFMFNECDLSSQCSNNRYRHLDDSEWSRWKLCKCKQCDDSIQWCNRNDL